MNVLLRIVMPGLAVVLLISCNGEPSSEEKIANYYVTKLGSPAPTGSSDKPYHVVRSATERARIYFEHDNEYKFNILIGPGKYYETFTISTPVVLKASSGVVTIGKLDYEARTTYGILTQNTHLFGDIIGPPKWQDDYRAADFPSAIAAINPVPDAVAFQEIWDEDLFIDGNSGILPAMFSYYPYGDIGDVVVFDPLRVPVNASHSGLALMLRQKPVANYSQHEYKYEYGVLESLSAKGWFHTTIVKDGFTIALFNTHTQADYSGSDIDARKLQIDEFSSAIKDYRTANPSHIVFAMGDFNVYGESGEYNNTLINMMGEIVGGYDADRNSPGFILYADDTKTYCTCNNATCCNLLADHFDHDESDGRLDYIFYYPDHDGAIEIIPKSVEVRKLQGRNQCCAEFQVVGMPSAVRMCAIDQTQICIDLPVIGEVCENTLCTTELSDHWGLLGRFDLIRVH